jgi:hypothetical protein
MILRLLHIVDPLPLGTSESQSKTILGSRQYFNNEFIVSVTMLFVVFKFLRSHLSSLLVITDHSPFNAFGDIDLQMLALETSIYRC